MANNKPPGKSNLSSFQPALDEERSDKHRKARSPWVKTSLSALLILTFLISLNGQVVCGGTQGKHSTRQERRAPSRTFTNPLLPSGADPWVINKGGVYYYMHTTGNNLTIWKTRNLADLKKAERKVVWTPPSSGPYSKDIWAPELHFLQGKWYIYFAADAGRNQSHRLWVLENESPDPLQEANG
jgi:hypothetical protein